MRKGVPTRSIHSLSVGQVAERSCVAVSALHFYEKKGLIRSARTDGNQRRYSRDVLRRLAVIRVAQQTGVPLATIRQAMTALPSDRPLTVAEWKKLSARWKEDLNHRIARLTDLRDRLGGCIGCGCMSLKVCPLRNAQDTLAAQGPGPHFGAGDS